MSNTSGDPANDILDYVWQIRVTLSNNKVSLTSGTGIRDHRILTCYHGFLDEFTKIEARRGNRPYHEMKIAYSMPRRDLATLKFKYRVPVFPYLELSINETLDVGDKILVAGHDNGGPAKETEALVVCSCIPVDPLNFRDDVQFVPSAEEHPCSRPYPIMHNFMNHGDFIGGYDYNPNIPLILINEWSIDCTGRSGGPVYRKVHKIVGVFIGGGAFGAWAVHLSAIRDFLEMAEIGDKTLKSARELQCSGGTSSSQNKPGVK